MYGAGSSCPGPGGAGGPGAAGPGGGAAAGFAGAGPGSGPSGSVRAPGGSGCDRHGCARHVGWTSPGRPAIGIPGVGGRPLGFGGDDAISGDAGYGPFGSEGALVLVDARTWHRVPGRGSSSGGGVYEQGDPGRDSRTRVIRGALQQLAVPAAAHRWGTECRWGRGTWNAGSPALRQKSSGSIPRFLNAASTHGCRIQYGNRLASRHLEIRSRSDGFVEARDVFAEHSALAPGRPCASPAGR